MYTSLLFVACFATNLYALPLNINLGAYSPALVVGDGEISFGGDQDVSNLMNALEGAAVTNAAANGAAAPGVEARPEQAQVEAAPVPEGEPASQDKTNQEAVQDLPQGMGKKQIDPRSDSAKSFARRAIEGFNAALDYASNALNRGPEIQLGTGEKGAGVGIIVRPPGTGNEARSVIERDVPTTKPKTTVTTMFIRGGPSVEKNLARRKLAASPAVRKRSQDSALDTVNLNMEDGQVAELTFFETNTGGNE